MGKERLSFRDLFMCLAGSWLSGAIFTSLFGFFSQFSSTGTAAIAGLGYGLSSTAMMMFFQRDEWKQRALGSGIANLAAGSAGAAAGFVTVTLAQQFIIDLNL